MGQPVHLSMVCFTTVLQLEIGLAPNISKVISNVLQVMVPKQKTAVFLKSIKDMSLREAYGECSEIYMCLHDHSKYFAVRILHFCMINKPNGCYV